MHLAAQLRVELLTREHLQAKHVTLLIHHVANGILIVMIGQKIRDHDGKSVTVSYGGRHDRTADIAVARKLEIVERTNAAHIRLLAHHARYHGLDLIPAHGINGYLIHLAHRKIRKGGGKPECLLCLLSVSVIHGAADVDINARVHLSLIKIELGIKLFKAGVGIPVDLGNIVAGYVFAQVRKLAGRTEILALPVTAEHTRNVVFEQRLQQLQLAQKRIVDCKSTHISIFIS